MQYETRKRVNELLAETGHALRVEDLEDVIALDEIAREVADATKGADFTPAMHPVYINGRPVYPLTVAHLSYIDECLRPWFGSQEETFGLALLWLVSMPSVPLECYEQAAATRTMRRWLRHCRWTQDDVAEVMALRYEPLRDRGGTDGDGKGDGGLFAMLAHEYGRTPDWWMTDATVDLVRYCVKDWSARQEQQAKAYRKAGGKNAPPPPPSPRVIACKKFREKSNEIRAKWQSASSN